MVLLLPPFRCANSYTPLELLDCSPAAHSSSTVLENSTQGRMHRGPSALRDELHSGGLLLAKPPTYHASTPAANTTAHFSSNPFFGFQADGSSKSCNLNQIQFPGEGLPLVDHDVLARSISYDMHHGISHDAHSLPSCSAISSPTGNTSIPAGGEVTNGALLNQLLFPSSASLRCSQAGQQWPWQSGRCFSPSCGSPPHQLLDRTVPTLMVDGNLPVIW